MAAKKKWIIKWTNIYSGDVGYVGGVGSDHFDNTDEMCTAKKFNTLKAAQATIVDLTEMGEAENNKLEAIAAV